MLKYNLIKETETEVQYNYFPEGDSESGVVSFDKKSNEGSIVYSPKNDRHQRYALKMLKRIKEFASDGSFKKEGIVAWY